MFAKLDQHIVQQLVNWRYACFLLAAVLFALAWVPSTQLAFDRSIENMFAPDDPLLVPFRQMRRTFGGDEVVLVAYDDPQSLETAGLQKLKGLTADLKQIDGVLSVLSVLDTPGGISPTSELAQPFLEMLEGFAISSDHRTVAAVCMLEPEKRAAARGVARTQVVEAIRAVTDKHAPQAVVAGEPVLVVDGFAALEADGQRLRIWTLSLLLLVILILFRSLRWVIIPVAVVQVTLVWTMAALVAFQFRLSMVSSMLAAIVTVIAIATIIHLIVRYRDARTSEAPREALLVASGLVAAPIFWACCTDAVGFGALMASRVGPVQSFGVMMALGALVTCAVVAFIVPLLALIGRIDLDPQAVWGESRLEAALERLAHGLERHPGPLAVGSLLAIAACMCGLPLLEIETDFTKNFRSGSPIVQSYQFVEDRLGGAGVWSVYLEAPQPLTPEYLKRIRKLEARLREEVVVAQNGETRPGLTKTLSLADVLDAGDESLKRLLPPAAASLLSAEQLLATKLTLIRGQLPAVHDSLYNQDPLSDQHYLRIMLRSREQQPKENKLQIIEGVQRIVREEFPEQADAGHQPVTGFFVLLAALIDSLLADQWVTFGIAAAGIGLMMLLAFRSAWLALIALVPNALPIVMVLGLMGLFGLKINMGTVMIAAVSMGLSVDSSIHYLATFRRSIRAGLSYRQAIDAVHESVGRAMVFSTIALIAGFTTLCLSEFVPTIYFGMLVSLAMLGGMLGNLVLLPLLLGLVHRDETAEEPVGKSVRERDAERYPT